jgi:hypothetical protein
VSVAASNWFIRLLPFGVLLLLVAGSAALVVCGVMIVKGAGRIVYRAVVSGLLLVGLSELGLGAFTVYAIHETYSLMATSPAYQQSLKEFDEFRKQQRQSGKQPQ